MDNAILKLPKKWQKMKNHFFLPKVKKWWTFKKQEKNEKSLKNDMLDSLTCLTTCVIQLEMAGDLSTDSFMSFKRFISWQGNTNIIFSDNGTKATATSRRQFTFYHSVPRNSWYSFYQHWKDERLSRPWSHPMVLNMGPLNWESSTLTTRPLLPPGPSEISTPPEIAVRMHFHAQTRH